MFLFCSLTFRLYMGIISIYNPKYKEDVFMENAKKALKIIAIIAAVAGALFGAYVLVKKYVDSKRVVIGNDAENYVSCSCCDDTFVSETVA